jgi:hypothetical protein
LDLGEWAALLNFQLAQTRTSATITASSMAWWQQNGPSTQRQLPTIFRRALKRALHRETK